MQVIQSEVDIYKWLKYLSPREHFGDNNAPLLLLPKNNNAPLLSGQTRVQMTSTVIDMLIIKKKKKLECFILAINYTKNCNFILCYF